MSLWDRLSMYSGQNSCLSSMAGGVHIKATAILGLGGEAVLLMRGALHLGA